jgi:hypothetical protein
LTERFQDAAADRRVEPGDVPLGPPGCIGDRGLVVIGPRLVILGRVARA